MEQSVSKNNQFSLLIVDDTQEIRELIKNVCISQNITADEAEDGRVAVTKLLKNHYHVVVTDIKMPRMDGIELTRWIKQFNKEIFVIVMTGYTDQFLWNEIAAAGADDFLTKPFNVQQMIIKVKSILRYQQLLETTENELQEIKSISNEMIDGLQNESMSAGLRLKDLESEIEKIKRKKSDHEKKIPDTDDGDRE